MKQIDRYKGCLLGLAVGDALGTTLEFKPPGTFKPITDMIGGGPFGLKPGQWTDDTSMALCLAESIVECQGFDMVDQLKRYVSWFRKGHLSSTGECFDIGNTVYRALLQYEETSDPFSGQADPMSAGNGSIMRLAPVPMTWAYDSEKAIHLCGESSKTTHALRATVDACRYFGGLIIGALKGESKEVLLSEKYCPIEGYWEKHPLVAAISQVAAGSFRRKSPPDIKGSGYVVHSLEAALWAFYKTNSFKEGALLAVNLGDDADTTGAVYGQIAGAYFGKLGIPQSWLQKVAMGEYIEEIVDGLSKLF